MKLRPPRFSMRMLLIAMLVIGAVFGLVGQELVRLRKLAEKQRAIISRLEKKGARFDLQFNGNRSVMEPLMEFIDGEPYPDVNSVALLQGAFDVNDARDIAALSGLRNITIANDACTDAWLSELARAPELWGVTIESKAYSARGAAALAQTNAPLGQVILLGASVDDEFLKHIAQKPSLEQLVIKGEGITAEGLGKLRDAKGLGDLRLYGGKSLGDGLTKLAEHPALLMLVLSDYEWTDGEDLGEISKLKSLKSLCIKSDKLPKGVLQAAAKLPNLTALQLIGDFHADEPLEQLAFAKLQLFSSGKEGKLCNGLLEQLAKCKTLKQIEAPLGSVTAEELELLATLPQLDEFTIGTSPSKDVIERFQRRQRFCVYIDGQWGLFQPKVGINPARMSGGGIRKDSIVAPAGMK